MNSKILFIDDEAEMLDAYKSLFQEKENNMLDDLLQDLSLVEEKINTPPQIKYTVSMASQGLEGLAKVKESLELGSPFQMVFIDMRMPPGINGAETAKLIREIDPDIEMVFVTAYSDINMKSLVEDLGCPDKMLYLKKPFDMQEVKQFALNLSHKYFNTKIKDTFLSNVTHELKTPLASILGFSNLIQDESEMHEIKDFNEIIYKNAHLMKSLIDDLLSSVNNMNNITVMEEFCLVPIIDHVFSMTHNSAKQKGLVFNVDVCNDANILGNKDRVTRLFINIVNNAIKFTEKGMVSINMKQEPESIIIDISDTGIGIDKDFFDKIFTRFFRIEDQHHNIPGFGLGLFMVKEIVEEHGGKITVESKINEGTKFSIRFPKVA